jgi:hypothetical protein
MARGWESKSVESQIEDQRQSRQSKKRLPQSAEEREIQSKREGLEMSRRRITRELENSRSETHRAALQNALAFLDEELKKLG